MAGRSTGAHAENSQSAGIRQRPGTGYFISDAGIVALALFAHGFGSAAEKKRKYGILTGKNTADDAIYSGETGFENMDYFCKTFKKYYGKTPTEYRRKKQMDTDDREWIVQDVV